MRNAGVRRRFPDHKKNKGFFRRRTIETFIEKRHRIRRMGQSPETGFMQRRDQKTGSNTDAFIDVIVFSIIACIDPAAPLGEDRDKVRRCFKERLTGICPDRRESVQPLITRTPTIKRALFLFGGLSDPAFDLGALHHGEMPGLVIGARRRPARSGNGVFDHFHGHRIGEKIPDCVTGGDSVKKGFCPGHACTFVEVRQVMQIPQQGKSWLVGHAGQITETALPTKARICLFNTEIKTARTRNP